MRAKIVSIVVMFVGEDVGFVFFCEMFALLEKCATTT
jgi:hypothetical protein